MNSPAHLSGQDNESTVDAQCRTGRVAFFGGSFDPPHLGHLAVARAAREALDLDRVLFAPVGAQPLKPEGSTAPFPHRLAMTELAIAGEPGFEISLVDAPNPGGTPNFTVDTLRALRAGLPRHGCLFCLMGADSFRSLRQWRGAADIPFAAALVVASRPGEQLDDLARFLPQGLSLEANQNPVDMQEEAVPLSSPRRTQDPHSTLKAAPAPAAPSIDLRRFTVRNPAGQTAPFYLLPGLDVEISASDIRAHIRSSAHAPGSLPPRVAEYIRAHGLYRA